jgi:hypothetical protein
MFSLKVSCIYVCKDTLWVGTSAGIIVNVKIPLINNNLTNKNVKPIHFNGNLKYNMTFRFDFNY